MDNSFTATGTFGKQGQPQNACPSTSECERQFSNLAKYKNGDISADNLVKIESSPEPSQRPQGNLKLNSQKSKVASGQANEGLTPPSIRVSQIELSQGTNPSHPVK